MKTITGTLLTVITAGLAIAQPARADVKIVQKTVIDCPGFKQIITEIPEQQRAPLMKLVSPMMLGTPWSTTTYVKGCRMRTDMGETTVVVNAESGKSFTLNHQTHKYSIGAYDPFQKATGNVSCVITPTSQQSDMLGYTVVRYAVSMRASVLPKSVITGEIWAAPGLPTPPVPGYLDGSAAALQEEMNKVKGMPLAYSLTYKNTPAGDIRVVSYATAIKETPLSTSIFHIPTDYEKGVTRTPMGMPTTGFPLGDGMPLDVDSPDISGDIESYAAPQQVTPHKKVARSTKKHTKPATGYPGDLSSISGLIGNGGGAGSISSLLGGGNGAGSISGLLGGGGSGGNLQQMLGNMSPSDMQKLLGMLGNQGGSGSSMGGISPEILGQVLGGMSGGGQSLGDLGGGGDISGMLNPQTLQQLSTSLQSLLQDE